VRDRGFKVLNPLLKSPDKLKGDIRYILYNI